jgi:DNA-binding HxlR family transcriptional regulator
MPERVGHRSECPLASALDIVGDRWTLIVVRGLFVGHSRYRDFLHGPEVIATNILADRLRLLESGGMVERLAVKGARSRARYRLTRKGADLLPALQSLARWGFEHIPERWKPPPWFLKAKPADFYPVRPAVRDHS